MALVPARRQQEDDEFVTDASFDGTKVKRGAGASEASGVRIDRGTGFGRAATGGRVRSRQPRRPSQPSGSEKRAIASPRRRQQAARNLVTAPDRDQLPDGRFPRDTAGDTDALLQAPIAGLTEGAVGQEDASFKQVTDPGTGLTVPNQADRDTKAAFRRFFDTSFRPGVNSQIPSQRDRNADPTRASFQNQFFPSETLKDSGIKKRTFF